MIIYLISSELNNDTLYKIGITRRDVTKRLKQLKTGNPATLSVVKTFESKWASKIESNLHSSYQTKNINGEWFKLEPNDVEGFEKRCQIIHNNFELLSKTNTWVIDKNKF